MSAVRVLAIITLLLCAHGVVHTDNCPILWLFEVAQEKATEKLPSEEDPLLEQDFNKHAAISNSSPRTPFLYLTSLVYSVTDFRHSSICLLKVCLRC